MTTSVGWGGAGPGLSRQSRYAGRRKTSKWEVCDVWEWSDCRRRSDCIGGKPGFVICSNGREATSTPNTPQRRWQSLHRPRREWKVTVALGSDGQSGQITGRAERMPDNSWANRHHHKPSLPAKTRHIKYGPPIRKHLGSVITAALSLWYSCGFGCLT